MNKKKNILIGVGMAVGLIGFGAWFLNKQLKNIGNALDSMSLI